MQGPRTLRHVVRSGAVVLGVLGWTALTVGTGPAATAGARAQATGESERIDRYAVTLQVAADGSMQVNETITYDFGAEHRHGIVRLIDLESRYDDDHDRTYPIDRITVSSPTGAPAEHSVTPGATVELRIGNPDNNSVTGKQTYVIGYHLTNVVTTFSDHQELYWNPVGTEWTVPIGASAVTVSGPAPVRATACFDGARGSTHPCPTTLMPGGAAEFTAHGLARGQGMTVVASFPTGTFANADPILHSHWTWSRAFSLTPATVGAALGVFLLLGGGAVVAVLRKGRDEHYFGLVPGLQPGYLRRHTIRRVPWWHQDPVAVRFTPPDEMRPGQLGALLHERARPIDVTATVVDLAVRGFIRIDRVGEHDWRLTQLPPPTGRAGRMGTFEARLFEAVFRGREQILLSQLRRTFRGTLRDIETRLELDVTERGWFTALPSRVRRRWAWYGVALTVTGVVLTALLAARTSAGLVGLAVVPAGLVLLALSSRMPARTARGTALLAQAKGFRLYLEKAEAKQIRFEEGADLFSRYLPFAIVLEVTDRWAKVFTELAATGAPPWFGAGGATTDAPDHRILAASLNDFSTSTSAALDGSVPLGAMGSFAALGLASTASPTSISSSGLGGDASTGSGGGGGGGGSW